MNCGDKVVGLCMYHINPNHPEQLLFGRVLSVGDDGKMSVQWATGKICHATYDYEVERVQSCGELCNEDPSWGFTKLK